MNLRLNIHFIFLIILSIIISIIIINRSQFHFKEHLFIITSKNIFEQFKPNTLDIVQSKLISLSKHKCDQIHTEISKTQSISDLGSKFRFYESDWDQKCAIFVLNNKNKIDIEEYTKDIDIAVKKILNLHIEKYNSANFIPTKRLDKVFEKYAEDSKIDPNYFDLVKEIYLIGKTSDKFAYDLDSVLKDKNYIQYLSSYNFIGIIQFIILTIIILLTFILYFFYLIRSN